MAFQFNTGAPVMKLYGAGRRLLCLSLFFLVCQAGNLCADKVVLKSGQMLTGDILSERPAQIIMDIGIEVLTIPKEKILEYEYTSSYSIDSEPNKSAGSKGQIFTVSNRPKMSIEKCVELVSEAVVKVSTPAGLGSGFFISKDGYLITNYHVVERETKIEVTVFQKSAEGFEKKNFKRVRIEALNPFVDLALLKVEDLGDTKVTAVPLGDIDRLEVGEQVFAIGNPLGLERTVTNGVVSTKNRAFEGLVYVQTNADINPGNSGGPLFNLSGEVIGVTNMGYIFTGGLGFAVPVDYVRQFLDNHEAFAYDKDNPNTGYRYIQPDKRKNKNKPGFLAGSK
jgi:serine protease Do